MTLFGLDVRLAVGIRGDRVCRGGCGVERIYYAFSTATHLSATKPDLVLLDLRTKTITVTEFSRLQRT